MESIISQSLVPAVPRKGRDHQDCYHAGLRDCSVGQQLHKFLGCGVIEKGAY
jgi:hypothetical protein